MISLETLLTASSGSLSPTDYVLKPLDRCEYFTPESQLNEYEYVHSCLKFDKDVDLELISSHEIYAPFLRTVSFELQNFKCIFFYSFI